MYTRAKQFTRLGVAAVALFFAGCAHSGAKGAKSAGRGGAGREFEISRDPPIASETRYAAGELAEGRGAFAQAADQYRQVLRKNPTHLPALYRLGVVYAHMKKFPEAVDTWKRYIAATHDSAAGYSNLGFCFELARRPQDAEAAYLKGIRRDPAHVACRVNYGLMLVRTGREAEGRMQLQAVLKPAEVHYNVGSVYDSLGRAEQAKFEYAQALALDPTLTDAQSRLDALKGGAATRPLEPVESTGVSRTE
jgi:tetratricopeptide (TPR) repeat protein